MTLEKYLVLAIIFGTCIGFVYFIKPKKPNSKVSVNNESPREANTVEGFSATEKKLIENKTWPQKVIGKIFVVDGAGKPGDSDFWAIASFEINGEEHPISIDMHPDIKTDAGVDIDSQETYILTLNAGHTDYSYLAFPVIKIENVK